MMKKQFLQAAFLGISFLSINLLSAQCSDLFISEYIEGSSYNKAIEIYNSSPDTINLADYEVHIFYNGNSTSSSTISLSTTLNSYSTYVIAHSSSDSAIAAVTDQATGSLNFNGDDAIALINTVTNDTLDIFGVIGVDPGSSWSITGTNSSNGNTANRTLVRDSTVQEGNKNWSVSSANEWMVFATDMVDSLGGHTANCPLSTSGLTTSISIDSLVSCNGGTDGGATVFANGGTAPYTYLWSNSAIDSNNTSLAAGSYFITVTDANSTSVVDSVSITEPSRLTASITIDSNVSCHGGSDGKLSVLANGGTSPYTYSWSNSTTNDSLNNIMAGLYVVTVTDSNSCTTTDSAVVSQPTALSVTTTVVNHVSFNGASDGSVSASASGGTAPYTYNWANGLPSIDTNTNLSAGNYQVTVSDANGCFVVDSVNLIVLSYHHSKLVITEIMYNAAESGTDTTEYIEILNADTATVALNGFSFPNGVAHTFGTLDSIAVGDYAIIAYDSSAFRNRYGFDADFIWSAGELSNGGELVVLADQFGRSIDSVDFDDATPWPFGSNAGEPDGGGASIELTDSSLNNILGQNWISSATAVQGQTINGFQVYGSPGRGPILVGLHQASFKQVNNFSIYPNPNNGALKLEVNKPLAQNSSSIQIYDLSGKVIYEEILSADRTILNLNELSNGIYFIRFQNETKKLILAK